MSVDPGLILVASLLRRGSSLNGLSSALTVLALALGFYGALMASATLAFSLSMALLVLLGLVQKFYAMRVALDADLFEAMANAGEALPEKTRQLDDALATHVGVPAEMSGRTWSERSRGALKLLRRQVMLCAVQWLVALLCLIALTFQS
ncbi:MULTISPECIES: hypothetical protein [Pseudomonas]|uniref:Uncharacterized protein n=1 Tax=Pseudomonas nitroreducens TaxID=46680 RepID=A0A6G6IPP2_PSENT|nr:MULTISPECIES: hypothetical protein [Pseudomonas]MBG6287581.1 hypothetical protein [Pseudomonas nitroreducens]MCJ1878900.1 hypothetical protein [Pseudomonas nitroreducens]MCJ1896286.1 hypothetical protein [Pseudomonas nitroreducens]MDG9852529.1 hypothetical protein [Pseudomonas nitroreducens]MDH1071669.1 hypothetical protein [Pseudomonas nitroreducens]